MNKTDEYTSESEKAMQATMDAFNEREKQSQAPNLDIPKLDLTNEEHNQIEEYFRIKAKKELHESDPTKPDLTDVEKSTFNNKDLDKLKKKYEHFQSKLDLELAGSPKKDRFVHFDSINDEPELHTSILDREFTRVHPKEKTRSIIEEEEMRILLDRVFIRTPCLKKFFNKFCKIDYKKLNDLNDPEPVGGAKVIPDIDPTTGRREYTIEIDEKSILTELTINRNGRQDKLMSYPDVSKLSFILLRAITQLLPNTEKLAYVWRQFQGKNQGKKVDNKSGDNNDWTAYFSLCIMEPERAQQLNPEAYQVFESYLKNDDLGDANIIPTEYKVENPELNHGFIDQVGKKEKKMSWWENMFAYGLLNGTMMYHGKGRYVFRENSDWHTKIITELDNKEVSRILAREEGIGERDKRLSELIRFGDKEGCRRLLIADAKTSDLQNWRMQLYARTFDPLYKRTNGMEITQETYFFFERCRRNSEKEGKRISTKKLDYSHNTKTDKYERVSDASWQKDCYSEWNAKSDREAQAVAQETFEHMEINFQYIGLDEKFGEGLDDPFNDRAWCVSTGDLRVILGDEKLAREFLTDMKKNAELNPGKFWNKKLDPDQITAIQRWHVLKDRLPPDKFEGGEHQKVFALKAYKFYQDKIDHPDKDKQTRTKDIFQELLDDSDSPEEKIGKLQCHDIDTIYQQIGKNEEITPIKMVTNKIKIIKENLRKSGLPDQVWTMMADEFDVLEKLDWGWKDEEKVNIKLADLKEKIDKFFVNHPNFSNHHEATQEVMIDFEKQLKKLGIAKKYTVIFEPYQKVIKEEESKSKKKFSKEHADLIDKYMEDVFPLEVKDVNGVSEGLSNDAVEKIVKELKDEVKKSKKDVITEREMQEEIFTIAETDYVGRKNKIQEIIERKKTKFDKYLKEGADHIRRLFVEIDQGIINHVDNHGDPKIFDRSTDEIEFTKACKAKYNLIKTVPKIPDSEEVNIGEIVDRLRIAFVVVMDKLEPPKVDKKEEKKSSKDDDD